MTSNLIVNWNNSNQLNFIAGPKWSCSNRNPVSLLNVVSLLTYLCFLKGAFPNFTKDPVVSVDVENNRLRFKCKIDPEEKADNVRYEIVWFQGRKPPKEIKSDVLTANITEAYLQNSDGASGQQMFNLGQEVGIFESNFLKFSWEIKTLNGIYHGKVAVICSVICEVWYYLYFASFTTIFFCILFKLSSNILSNLCPKF